ncbi:DUF2070 family protein [Paenibacillus pasadenensis]|uniref:DUF2070 family protein n=1 Tax=Paenibacillus pasadenensis TaxID=217090 RepID=UPI00203CA7E5|nr:DUF2070 family protein [Paenibacillus pasadenensis]MCM3750305.1 DUF2070 family protein [Paenibacillus pasadenensis]
MLSHLLYLTLGILDALAVWALALSLFRIPALRHWPTIVGSSLVISVLSYFNRMVMQAPVFDVLAQFILYMLATVLLMRYRAFWAAIIITAGYAQFLALQSTLYLLLTSFSLLPSTIVGDNTGLVFVLQILTDSFAFLIAIALGLTGKRFRFIPPAPQRAKSWSVYLAPQHEKLVIALAAGLINVVFSLFFMLNGRFFFSYISTLITLGSMLFLFYLTEKRIREERQNPPGNDSDVGM